MSDSSSSSCQAAPSPGRQVGAPLRAAAEDHGGVVRDVEEDQVEGHKVDHHPQEDHWGPSEATVLAQQAKQSSAWRKQRRLHFIAPPALAADDGQISLFKVLYCVKFTLSLVHMKESMWIQPFVTSQRALMPH